MSEENPLRPDVLPTQLQALVNEKLPAPNADAASEQRLRLHVPTPGGSSKGSTLTLGHRLEGTAYEGCALSTHGHIVLQARGERLQSTINVHAHGRVTLQSDHYDVNVLAFTDLVASSGASSFYTARSGITLLAGLDVQTASLNTVEPKPNAAPSGGALLKSLDHAQDFWEHAQGLLLHRAQTVQRTIGQCESFPARSIPSLTEDYALRSVGYSAMHTYSQGKVPTLAGGLSLYGHHGVLLGSPETCTITAGDSLCLSAREALLNAETLELSSTRAVRITSHAMRFSADGCAEWSAGGTLQLNARRGALQLRGVDISIGAAHAHDLQGETSRISLDAVSTVELTSNGTGPRDGVHFTSENTVSASAKKRVEMVSQEEVVIQVGKHAIVVRGDAITIGRWQDSSKPDEQAYVHIEDGRILLGVGPCGLEITKDFAAFGKLDAGQFKRGVRFDASTEALSLTASKIKLGTG